MSDMHQIVQKFINGELAEPMAATLVGGGIPLPTLDLLHALAHAVFGETPLKDTALETLAGLPASILKGAIGGPVESPGPLGLVLIHRSEPDILEAALLNKCLSAEWMERVIPSLHGLFLEMALNNQALWMLRPTILDALESHPEGSTNLKRRITEFRRDVLKQLDSAGAVERMEIIDEVEAGALDAAWTTLPLAAEHTPPKRREPPVKEKGAATVAQRIARLAVNQKVILAMRGGKEERAILMRDPNRLIQVNVIHNPRITEGEVAQMAQMRTADEEVIRIIASNREWTRHYPIVKGLAHNPRTPLTIAMGLVKRLNELDLKLMAIDHNIAEPLRREAKKLVDNKMAGRG